MNGWTDVWVDKWLDGVIDGWKDGEMHIYGLDDGCMGG